MANIVSLVWRSCASKIVRQKSNATRLLTTFFCVDYFIITKVYVGLIVDIVE